MTLDQLSAAATETQRLLPEFYLSPFYKTEYARPCDKVKAVIEFTLARTGQLVVAQADDATVERVARSLCEHHIREVRRHDTTPEKLEAMIKAAVDYAWQDFVNPAKAAISALAAKGDA